MSPNVTLQQFLSGETLEYHAPGPPPKKKNGKRKLRAILATYRAGDGIYLEDQDGADLGKAPVVDDTGASRAYHNLTRSSDG
jgi:hypothetical protein